MRLKKLFTVFLVTTLFLSILPFTFVPKVKSTVHQQTSVNATGSHTRCYANGNADYDTAHDSGTSTSSSAVNLYVGQEVFASGDYGIHRTALVFLVPDWEYEITGAILSLYTSSKYVDDSYNVTIFQDSSGEYPLMPYTSVNYNYSHYDTTHKSINVTEFTTDEYKNITMPESYVQSLTKGSYSKLFLRSSKDVSSTAPDSTPFTKEYIKFSYAGGSNPPKLFLLFESDVNIDVSKYSEIDPNNDIDMQPYGFQMSFNTFDNAYVYTDNFTALFDFEITENKNFNMLVNYSDVDPSGYHYEESSPYTYLFGVLSDQNGTVDELLTNNATFVGLVACVDTDWQLYVNAVGYKDGVQVSLTSHKSGGGGWMITNYGDPFNLNLRVMRLNGEITYYVSNLGKSLSCTYTDTIDSAFTWFMPFIVYDPYMESEYGHAIDLTFIGASFEEFVWNEDVTISNMEGCGNWVVAEEDFYAFDAQYGYWNASDDAATYIDFAKIAFTDTVHWMNATYDVQEEEFTIETGNEIFALKAGTITESGQYLNVTFEIYLYDKVIDMLDVDIYMYVNDTAGNEDSWEIQATDYFNIYHLGGYPEWTDSGYGGRTTGGEAFELWAGEEGFTEYFWDDFERDEIETWGLYIANSTYVDIYLDKVKTPGTGTWKYRAAYFKDESDADDDYGLMWHRFPVVDSGVFYVTFEYMPFQTTEDQSFVITNSTEGALGGPWVYFADDNKIYYVNSTGDHNEIRASYGSLEWKNCTFVINVTDQTYDFYYEDVLLLDDGDFYAERTGFDLLYTSTYLYDSPHTNNVTHGWVDNVHVWIDELPGNKGGTSQVTITYRNLQHIHSLFAIGLPDAVEALEYNDDWFVEWGIDYCIDDTWINNAWKVMVEAQKADIGHAVNFGSAGQNWIQLKVSWYERNTTLIDTEYFYTFWEGGPGGLSTEGEQADFFRVYLDLWFNSINASSTIGGRVSSYYYGMSDRSDPWWRWWTGSNWKIVGSERAQSMYFADLEDSSDSIRSCKEITMMRIRAKVWRSADYEYACRLEEFDLLSYEFASDTMTGIDTPIFTETRIPTMPQGGFLGALAAAFSRLINFLIRALSAGLTSFSHIAVDFLDTMFTMAGWPNGFSQILSWISSFLGWVSTSISTLIDILTIMYELVSGPLVDFITVIGTLVTNTVSVLTGMMTQLTNAYNDTVLPLTPMIVPVITLIGVMLPFWELVRMEQQGFAILFQDVNMVINLFSFFISMFLGVVNFVLALISKIIESIPVVE